MDEVAILCPGPSLANLTAERLGKPRAIIAVNSAMDHPLAAGCDYWCAHDLWAPPLVLPKQAPRMGMVTCWAAIQEGQAKYVPYRLINFLGSRYASPVRITTSAAIYWAAEILARMDHGTIRMHGCDMRGTGHWDGRDDPHWTDAEWKLARADMQQAMDSIPFDVEGTPW